MFSSSPELQTHQTTYTNSRKSKLQLSNKVHIYKPPFGLPPHFLKTQTPALSCSGRIPGGRGMINKMVFHLMGEQKDEDEHKDWCPRAGR